MAKRASRVLYGDANQDNLSSHFGSADWLGVQEHIDHLLQWVTYWRRNIHRFATSYLGLSLYWYQMITLYLMNISTNFMCIAARSAAKSYILAIFACCKAILYPGSIIVIASGTKSQAKNIITQKIKNELMNQSPILRCEIRKINENQSDIYVEFNNGSIIRVVPASENARGGRSTVMVYEECRLVKKDTIDSILSPFQIVRQVPYMRLDEYSSNKDLLEEATSIYISSNWFKNHWMSDEMDSTMADMLNGGDSTIVAFDYSITLRHNIKTRSFMEAAKRRTDPLTWAIEYENLRPTENTHAYFTYSMLTKCQTLRNVFYPRRVTQTKYKCNIPRRDGEIRLLACDIAMMGGAENDNSVYTCLRLLPEATSEDDRNKFGYRIQMPYMEPANGMDTLQQVIRIKQLEADFDADYIILDARSFGISIYDTGARVIYDEQRGVEYAPWKCMNNADIAAHVSTSGAKENLFAITANLRLNNDMAVNVLDLINSGKIELPVPLSVAEETLMQNQEYATTDDEWTVLFYRGPYMETGLLIDEMANLEYEKLEQTGVIRLSEASSRRKDRYVSFAMGCYFATELSRDTYQHKTIDLKNYTAPVYNLDNFFNMPS